MTISHYKPTSPRFKDLFGQVFGKLMVIGCDKVVFQYNRNMYYWLCWCECGNFVSCRSSNLVTGNSQSCGCDRIDFISKLNLKHGKTETPEYISWLHIRSRCCNKNNKRYADYGGRGIKVCKRWLNKEHGFENFLEDMGPRPSDKHSIDRIDNNGNYTPENCRWATQKEQVRNSRHNRMITFKGKTMCLSAWAEHLNIEHKTLNSRLKRGWSVEDAFLTPVRQ